MNYTNLNIVKCVFFRLAFIPPTIFYTIVVKTFYDMVNMLASAAKSKQISCIGYYSGIVAMFGLGLVSATMENGREDDPYHIIGALAMFVG